jgi:Histidine kinase-, DNA gyrase B-, and HSP90-like ATPase/His Kinase A (phospho-acceptor) domain
VAAPARSRHQSGRSGYARHFLIDRYREYGIREVSHVFYEGVRHLRELESDFAHMNRVSMMGELAASLSHEITQPIASARNNARAAQNFLDMQPSNPGAVREALSCVIGDVDRAGDIIDRMRQHMKKAPPRKERFDLNAAINEVITLARSVINRNGVLVQTRLADGLFPVQGDRVQLQQVVLNLILNAVEAMGSLETGARELLISTGQDHTGVLVAVRDSGPGIDPTHLEHVFEAFYTTNPAAWGWGCLFAGRSSPRMGAGCGRRRTNLAAPCFSSPCPAPKESSPILCSRSTRRESRAMTRSRGNCRAGHHRNRQGWHTGVATHDLRVIRGQRAAQANRTGIHAGHRSRVRRGFRETPSLEIWRSSGGAFDDIFFKHAKTIYVEPFELPLSGRFWMSYDHGSTRPYACLFWWESDESDIQLKSAGGARGSLRALLSEFTTRPATRA